VAEMLGMAYIRVLEVATFYFMFQLQPVGSVAHVQVCGTTPCMLCGAEALIEVCRAKIAAEPHRLSDDGRFSWEEVECLGACANAPMVQIGKDFYEDLTPESFAAILDALARGEVPRPGPQNGRFSSEPAGGATTRQLAASGRTGQPPQSTRGHDNRRLDVSRVIKFYVIEGQRGADMTDISDATLTVTTRQVVGGAIAFAGTLALAGWAVLGFTLGGLTDDIADIRERLTVNSSQDMSIQRENHDTETELRGELVELTTELRATNDAIRDLVTAVNQLKDSLSVVDRRLTSSIDRQQNFERWVVARLAAPIRGSTEVLPELWREAQFKVYDALTTGADDPLYEWYQGLSTKK